MPEDLLQLPEALGDRVLARAPDVVCPLRGAEHGVRLLGGHQRRLADLLRRHLCFLQRSRLPGDAFVLIARGPVESRDLLGERQHRLTQAPRHLAQLGDQLRERGREPADLVVAGDLDLLRQVSVADDALDRRTERIERPDHALREEPRRQGCEHGGDHRHQRDRYQELPQRRERNRTWHPADVGEPATRVGGPGIVARPGDQQLAALAPPSRTRARREQQRILAG